MNRILVTGASGTIGNSLIKFLIAEDKYEITALDLKSTKSIKRFRSFRKNINIIYGDITEDTLMRALIKDHDYIIHLAGVIPPFADIKASLCRIVDYEGTKKIINIINEVNPKCHMFFASTTTVYGPRSNREEITVKDEVSIDTDDNYSLVKIRCEEKIKSGLKNYTIFRLSSVLGDIKKDAPMYNVPLKSNVEFITADDAARSFVKAIGAAKKLNKKTYNVTGGVPCRTSFRKFLLKVLQIHGISLRLIGTGILIDKNFYSHYYEDSKVIDDILGFSQDSIDEYFNILQKKTNKITRFLPKLLAKPLILAIKNRKIK